MRSLNRKKGITLIAVVITVLVSIILVSVSIGAINGGLFDYAGKAKKDTENASNRDGVKESFVLAKDNSKTGEITLEDMQEALDKVFGENGAEAIDNEGGITIRIEDKYYEMDNEGNIGEGKTITTVPNAGNLAKTGNGTSGNPYKIRCIEDLVALAKDVNTGTTYANKYIRLEKDLDFNSIYSYSNYAAKYIYNSENICYEPDLTGTSETTIKELCTTGQGFIPIGNVTNSKVFSGTFYGTEQREIKNIYIQRSNTAALFGYCSNAYGSVTIKKITIDGAITCTGGSLAAGFIGSVSQGRKIYLEECINKATIENTGTGSAVGFAAGPYSGRRRYNN